MPGSNPVASTPGASHSKSFRSRLGFGGGGSVPSTKPSFFSLRPGRKSFGGSGDSKTYDRPVLVIDAEPEHGRSSQENRVVLNEDTERNQPPHSPPKSESFIKDLPFRLPRNIITQSLPASPTRSGQHSSHSHNTNVDFQSSSPKGAGFQIDPDGSGLSKQLPDLSTDLSLLMNEPPPDMVSQSDQESKHSYSDINGTTVVSSKGKTRETRPASHPSVALDNNDRSQHRNVHDLAASVHKIRSAIPVQPEAPEGGDSAVSGFTNDAVENTSMSFDLSGAKLSLELMRQSLRDDWARNLEVEDSAVDSAETNALLRPPGSALVESHSGPVTSTPFRQSRTPPVRTQDTSAEPSFNLDSLDPDLVAFLRPNAYNRRQSQMNRVLMPSPLEPFAPPPDPLNPDTTAKPAPAPLTSPSTPSSSNRVNDQIDGAAQLSARKYATLSASTSPVKPLRLPRSNTVQEFTPCVSNSSKIDDLLDLLRVHTRADGQPSPSTIAPFSGIGTPSDASKQPSPLSATPVTFDDLERRTSPTQSSATSVSTSNFNNVTTRRTTRTATLLQDHVPRPRSALTFTTDSRPVARYSFQGNDRDLRQTSASPSPNSPGPYIYATGSLGRERDRTRPPLDGLFRGRFSPERSAGQPTSASSGGRSHNLLHAGPSLSGASPQAREGEWDGSTERRYRKRSMSLDQGATGGVHRGMTENSARPGGISSRFRPLGDRDRVAEWAGPEGSEFTGYGPHGALDASFDGRYRDRDRERFGYGHGDRERHARHPTDWLGPRTAKAFAAAGLLDDTRESSGLRNGAFSRSTSERDFRPPGTGHGRERERERERWSPVNTGTSGDGERNKPRHRYTFSSTARSGSDRDYTSSGMRAGAETPSTSSMTRPPSRGEYSSHSRPAPLFARTISDLMSQRGTDSRESGSSTHHRAGSAYSPGGIGTGGDSAGSGGGRASPTTTSSLVAVQSQIQHLKEKHDTQTEALLAALADSQKIARELKEENETLKEKLGALEERLVETIASSRQKEKELVRKMKARPQSPERTNLSRSHRNSNHRHLPASQPSKSPPKSTTSIKKRRVSTSSSVFPTVPTSMSLLMAESPGSPPQGSLASMSRPPSPTLVLPTRLASHQKLSDGREVDGNNGTPMAASRPISISHRRSTSGASMATTANFSFDTGSPGSLKLKPEHELLLGDMTRLSLITGFGGDSENEG